MFQDIDNIVPYGYDPEYHREADPITYKLSKNNGALMKAR